MTQRWLGLGLTAILAMAGAGCPGGRTSATASSVDSDTGRFPHARHDTLACTDCHALSAVLAGRPALPGADQHQPCARSGCHRKAFLTLPGPLCEICHLKVDPRIPGSSVSAPYPPDRGRRAEASRFSHADHLDFAAMEKRVGFHVSCSDCHQFDSAGALEPPDHAVCDRCHAPGAAPDQTPTMADCLDCHQPRKRAPSRNRRLIVGDLRFRHGNHRTDRKGKPILCRDCHPDSATVTEVGKHPLPTTRACVACHDDVDRTPSALRMRACETCHATRSGTFGQLAPRSHLPAPERPEDHTLAFRRDHSADAALHSTRCARCHTFMSGSARDTCDECHQVMRPQDHVVLWREYGHGPEAAARSDRCATCHQGEFCAACHSRPPRSHYPLYDFRNGGHAGLARYDLRACMTCHVPSQDCDVCHQTRGALR